MLFYGPPGTGKTSTVLALAKDLYGPDLFKSRVLELNASDERGISIVREKVKNFARMQLSNAPRSATSKYPCPPFKMIILDEADSMTQDAQSALRRTMETYSKITRFCLICNYVTRIIDPLASRCSKFRFKMLDSDDARRRLQQIATTEAVPLDQGAVDALIRCSDGDLRKAITFLQSAARLVGAMKRSPSGPSLKGRKSASASTTATVGGPDSDVMDVDDIRSSTTTITTTTTTGPAVTVQVIEEIAGVIPTETVARLKQSMRPRAKEAVYDAVSSVVTDMVADGWSASQIISQVKLSPLTLPSFPYRELIG